MYKLLIVDDEEIEREGMAKFICWEKYNIKLVGTAWNGVEGFQKIQESTPDIVLTDIKMPIMDGIELIRKVRQSYEDIEFVILSGYGEYEFTSQAMREGVRHYLLKPCNEKKVVEILEKVKRELDEKRRKKSQEKEYRKTVYRLLPRAKEQIFRNMLLEREQVQEEYQMFVKEIGNEQVKVFLLACKCEMGFDYLEQFVLKNILEELLGEENVLLTSAIQNNMMFLLEAGTREHIKGVLEKAKEEFRKIKMTRIQSVISETGSIREVHVLYTQIQELQHIGSVEKEVDFLHYGLFHEWGNKTMFFIDKEKLLQANQYVEVLFEICLSFLKMKFQKYQYEQVKEIWGWALKMLYGEELILEKNMNGWGELLEKLADIVAEKQSVKVSERKEAQRMKKILNAIFRHIGNSKLNIQFLAKEVLFMNEEYFGRLFVKNYEMKFSVFLLEQRIEFAKRLLKYDTDMKISNIVELTGFASDGQYFSKVFKKAVGMPPTEYRDNKKQ